MQPHPTTKRDTKTPRYFLAGEAYGTKKAVQERIARMLFGYALGATVSREDEAILLELLSHHHHRAEKIGAGIARICVVQNRLYPNTRCFWIKRIDGTETDFSYRQCITQSTPWQDVMHALRVGIDGQIVERKSRAFGGRSIILCPITDHKCAWDEMHVDHRPPLTFAQLARDFLTWKHLEAHEVPLRGGDQYVGDVLDDPCLLEAWQEFHRHFADLWVISKEAHLQLTRQRLQAAHKGDQV